MEKDLKDNMFKAFKANTILSKQKAAKQKLRKSNRNSKPEEC